MPQPEKKLDPAASPQAWFGSELRRCRKAQGFSAQTLGKLVQVSADVILRAEHGKYPALRREIAQDLDEALKSDGLFDRAWPMAFGGRDADKKRPDAEQAPKKIVGPPARPLAGSILEDDDAPTRAGSRVPVDRRSFLQAGSLAAIAPLDLVQAFSPSALQLPDAVGAGHVDQLQEVATAISSWDNRFGGGMVRGIAEPAMQWATGLLHAQCPPRLRPDLHAAVSRLGLVVGAAGFDSYEHAYATKSFILAADCAEEAGNWHLRAKSFSFLARQAVWTGKADDGVTYAEKGLVRSDRLTATERAMLHTARARAFGKMGNLRECMLAVGQADDAFAHAAPDNDPPWMAYYDQAQHHGDTAHALFDLVIRADQDPGRAAGRLEKAVKGHSDAYKRSRAISRTKLASLLMAKDDPQRAAAIGHKALDEVGRLTSRRAADDLRELGDFAARHPRCEQAADLRRRITTTITA